MRITRREFLKVATTSAFALGLNQMHLFNLEKTFLAPGGKTPVIWLSGRAVLAVPSLSSMLSIPPSTRYLPMSSTWDFIPT